MIVVYTGDGKGKTSAALGQIVRALGHGMRVACVQFMKRDKIAGEQQYLAGLLGDDFHVGGLGFFRKREDFAEHRQAALSALDWAAQRIAGGVQMLVLDESLYALNAGLIDRKELQQVMDAAMANTVHLVLTGRGLPDWLLEKADMVTEMVSRKHPFDHGRGAVSGIDY